MAWRDLCSIKKDNRSKLRNGGWAFDTYPELETLDAGKAMNLAQIEGPAVITCIHLTQHFIYEAGDLSAHERKALGARGIILEVYFDDAATPAVRAPLGDFFADGCGGRAVYFSTRFVEKAPEAYNCYIPMPFRKSRNLGLNPDPPEHDPAHDGSGSSSCVCANSYDTSSM